MIGTFVAVGALSNGQQLPSSQQLAQELVEPTQKWHMIFDVSCSREQHGENVIGRYWCHVPVTGIVSKSSVLQQDFYAGAQSEVPSHAPPSNALLSEPPVWFPYNNWVHEFNGSPIPGGNASATKRLNGWTSGYYLTQDCMPRLMANLMGRTVRLRGLGYAPPGETLADLQFALFGNLVGAYIDLPGNLYHTFDGYGDLAEGTYWDVSTEVPAGVDYTALTGGSRWSWLAAPGQETVEDTIANFMGPWLEADGPGVVVVNLARSGTGLQDGGHWTRDDIWPASLHAKLWPTLGSTSNRRVHLMCNGVGNDPAEYAANLVVWMSRVSAADPTAQFAICTAYDSLDYGPAQHAHEYVAARQHGLLLLPTSESLPDYDQGRSRFLAFASDGYTDCVSSDVGKTVAGGSTGDTGALIKYDNTLRIWTILPDAVTDAFDVEETVAVGGGTGAGTTVNTLTLTFGATYTDCVSSDVGKTVAGGSTGDTGTLLYYLNFARSWLVRPDETGDEFAESEEITIGGGIGAGMTLEASVEAASYGGFYGDITHRDKRDYFVAMDQLIKFVADHGNHACAISTDLSAGLTVGVEATIAGIGLVIGDPVSVIVGGIPWGEPTVVGPDGTWSITDIPVAAGQYLDVVATAGPYSCHSRWVSVTEL